MSPFRPRKSSEEPRFRMQAETQQASGVDAGYPVPKLCSHEAVISYSRGEFDCLAKQLRGQSPSVWHFLSWSAYSSCAPTALAHRQCPLKRCNHTIINDPDMLRAHVFSCAFLSDGCYWCYHCNREERFTPFQCKDCPKSPFRKDRLSQKAKKMFRWLGSKTQQKDFSVRRRATLHQETSYSAHWRSDSDFMNPGSKAQIEGCTGHDVSELGGDFTAVELSGYEKPLAELDSICQDDSTIRPDIFDLGFQPQHCQNSISKTSRCHSTFSARMSDTDSLQTRLYERQGFDGHSRYNAASQISSNNGLPRLQSPISPLSPGDRVNATSSSPTDTICSEDSLFSKSSSETSTSSISTQNSSDMHMPPGLPIDEQLRKPVNAAQSASSDGRAQKPRSVEEWESSCQHPDVLADFLCGKDCGTLDLPNSSRWLSPEHVVQDLWVIIESHVEVSKEKLRQLPISLSVGDLLQMTPEVIAMRGLVIWRRMLTGSLPTSVADLFSLLHVTYACAMLLHDFKITNRLQHLVSHALLIEAGALSAEDKVLYSKILEILWQPPVQLVLQHERHAAKTGQNMMRSGQLQANEPLDSSLRCTHMSLDGAAAIVGGNKVFGVLNDFLTLLDGAALLSRLSTVDASPHFNIRDDGFVGRVTQSIIGPLMPRFQQPEPSLVALASEIRKIETLVETGRISSIREVEVGLIWAARLTVPSLSLYETISGRVKELCLLFCEADYNLQSTRSTKGIEQLRQMLDKVQSKFKSPHSIEMQQRWTNMSTKGSPQPPHATDLLITDMTRDLVSCEANDRHAMESESQSNASAKRRRISVLNIDESLSRSTSPADALPQSADSELANFLCSDCGYRPAGNPKWHRGNFSKHMKTHGNNEKFPCPYHGCGKSYTRSDNLGHHIKEQHTKNTYLRDPKYSPKEAESFGDHLGSSYNEDLPGPNFDYPGQYL